MSLYPVNTTFAIRAAAGETKMAAMVHLIICVVQGVQACNLGVPIRTEEIAAGAAPEVRP